MAKFDFTYTDNEGDLYSSEQFNSLSEAKAKWQRLRKIYDGDCRLEETWKYSDDGDFLGRWN